MAGQNCTSFLQPYFLLVRLECECIKVLNILQISFHFSPCLSHRVTWLSSNLYPVLLLLPRVSISLGFIFSIELENRNVLISWKLLVLQSGYNLPRFWEVTWAHTFSPVLARNITEVEPTLLRQDQVYIEVGETQ